MGMPRSEVHRQNVDRDARHFLAALAALQLVLEVVVARRMAVLPILQVDRDVRSWNDRLLAYNASPLFWLSHFPH